MATPLQSSTRLEALEKGTYSPLTSFFSAQKVSIAYSDTLRFLGKLEGFPYVRKALADPSFLCRRQLAFLQVHNYWMPQDSRPFKQLWKGFWPAAKQVKDLFFFSTNLLHQQPLNRSQVTLGPIRLNNTRNTLVYLPSWKGTKRQVSCLSKRECGPSY